jgi:flavin reductase (DIM6/NTAB) family NADH-FMN oxidoreductase RutF/rubredoxin
MLPNDWFILLPSFIRFALVLSASYNILAHLLGIRLFLLRFLSNAYIIIFVEHETIASDKDMRQTIVETGKERIMNTKVLRNLSYGVYVVSTMDKGRPTGCTANSIMQITSSPPTLAASINHDNYTNQCIKETGLFSVSIISENTDPSVIGTFGFRSGKDTDKFANIPYEMVAGVPVLAHCSGCIICKVIDSMETSTHTVFLGEVIDGDLVDNGTPMTYAYYHQVIKGTSPKNAPTYIAEEETKMDEKKAVWVCSVCGYAYDEEIPFEELPDDYVCPVCLAPKDKFEKQ